MNEFLKFFDRTTRGFPMHLEIYYSKTMDWYIRVFRRGCGESGEDIEIAEVQSCDIEYAFAKAHVMLKDWLLENEGGVLTHA